MFETAPKGTFIVDTSTISPNASKEFAGEAKQKGMVFVDSPMSGGTVGARNGTLTFMVGAEKEEVERMEKMLLGMGNHVVHCGPPGAGESIKICNNMILAINMAAACEGLSMA